MPRTLTSILLIGLLTTVSSFGESLDESLIEAVMDGDVLTVKALLDKGVDPSEGAQWFTALMFAALKKAQLLPRPSGQGRDERAAASIKIPAIAIESGDADTAKCLVTHDAKWRPIY